MGEDPGTASEEREAKAEKNKSEKIKPDKINSYKIDIEALLERGETVQIHPQGYSMWPMFIPGKDEAVIGRADVGSLRRGDVALYRRDSGILVLHRVWARRPEGFYMIGDNQTETEGPLRQEQIKGVLLAFVKGGRKISVRNPLYILACRLWMAARPLRGIVRKIRQRCRSTGGDGA